MNKMFELDSQVFLYEENIHGGCLLTLLLLIMVIIEF